MNTLTKIIIIHSWLLIIFLPIDAYMLYYIKTHNIEIKNLYLNVHQKYGFLKIEILKLLVASFVIYNLIFEPMIGRVKFLALILLYIFYVVKTFVDLIYKRDGLI